MAFMKGMQAGDIKMEGDFGLLMWFNNAAKYLQPDIPKPVLTNHSLDLDILYLNIAKLPIPKPTKHNPKPIFLLVFNTFGSNGWVR